MSWVSTNEIMGNDGSIDDRTQRRYRRRFRVIFDHTQHDIVDAREAPGIPTMFSSYEGPAGQNQDAKAICVSKAAAQDDWPMIWIVECNYASVNRLKTMRLAWCQDKRPMVRDYNGRATTNSAEGYFDPPLELDFSRPIIQITRFEEVFAFATFALYADTVNSDEWLGFQPGQCKISAPPAESTYESGSFGWMVTYEIHVKWEGWDTWAQDAGYRELVDGKERVIFDEFGNVSSSPVLLNGKGRPLRLAKTNLSGALDATQDTVAIAATDFDLFPDPPFQVRIGPKLSGEVMNVKENIDDGGELSFKVDRGWMGSTAATHADGAEVTMEPYFLRFKGYRPQAFGSLNLP